VQVGSLREIVREARARTGVPGVAAGILRDGEVETCADGVLQLGSDVPVRPETPFRVASISKPFTASLAVSSLPLDEPLERWLSHTAGFRCESETPLPPGAEGLFSYSNAGYWAAGREVVRVLGAPFEQAMRDRILAPLGLAATGYDDPGAVAARGHLQQGETGHRAVPDDAYPVERRPSGGLWSTVGDLLGFAAHQLGGPGPLTDEARAAMREPRSRALGAGYGLGWWVRDAGGRAALDHEGSVAGYQSLLLLVPEDGFALVVLTNSWRGSGLVRRVVEQLELAPRVAGGPGGVRPSDVAGRYALDAAEAVVEAFDDALIVEEVDVDPVTGSRIAAPRYPAAELGDGVFGIAGGLLMSHRLDFPRPGFARVGWLVLPRVEP
jgi:CubicO group peptidase (beta-lactamase class C family)